MVCLFQFFLFRHTHCKSRVERRSFSKRMSSSHSFVPAILLNLSDAARKRGENSLVAPAFMTTFLSTRSFWSWKTTWWSEANWNQWTNFSTSNSLISKFWTKTNIRIWSFFFSVFSLRLLNSPIFLFDRCLWKIALSEARLCAMFGYQLLRWMSNCCKMQPDEKPKETVDGEARNEKYQKDISAFSLW